MGRQMTASVSVRPETRRALWQRKSDTTDTYDEVITQLIQSADGGTD